MPPQTTGVRRLWGNAEADSWRKREHCSPFLPGPFFALTLLLPLSFTFLEMGGLGLYLPPSFTSVYAKGGDGRVGGPTESTAPLACTEAASFLLLSGIKGWAAARVWEVMLGLQEHASMTEFKESRGHLREAHDARRHSGGREGIRKEEKFFGEHESAGQLLERGTVGGDRMSFAWNRD